MPNFLESMRLKNLFSVPPISSGIPPDLTNPATLDMSGVYGNGANQGVAPITPPMIPPEYDVNARMKQLYNPSTDASQRLEGMIDQYPQRENPSMLRRLGSMLVDYTKGPKEGQAMFDQPFNDQLTDWKNKVGPVENAANLERYQNTNDRTLAYQTISNELRDRVADAKNKNDEGKMKIAQQRADIYDFKARNPNHQFNFMGPKVIVTDPATGQITRTEFDTGNLTATDKINLQHENRMSEIGAQGANAQNLEGTRQTGRETIAETRGWSVVNIEDPENPGKQIAVKINAITGEIKPVKMDEKSVGPIAKPSGAGSKPETAANKLTREYLLAQELKNTRPDLAPFIKLDTRGAKTYDIVPPSFSKLRGDSGPTQKQLDEIRDHIFGDMPSVSLGGQSNKPVKVRNKQGQTGTWKGTEAEAIAAGYEVVK